MSLRQALLARLRDLGGREPLPLRVVFWDGETFDFGPAARVTLTIHNPKIMRAFLTGRIDRLGDAYARGDLTADGAVEDILQVGMRIAERLGKLSPLAIVARPLAALVFRHSRRADAAAIARHYDISNDFYRLWLDQSMTYSCAYFKTGSEDIDTAQAQKLDHICRKLRLKPGQRLLDVGCGWGGLLRHAVRTYGVRAVGVTNSAAQYELARERVAADGLTGQIELHYGDYRDLEGSGAYDKVVSVGMYEHVGLANLPVYFDKIARLLKPGGALLNHGIVTTDWRGKAQGPPGGEFIGRHVFPGGELPNLPRALTHVLQSGLEPVDVEDLRPHYARTLLLWSRRLEAHAEAAIAAAGIEQYRIWRIYLAGMALAFDRGWLSVAQVLAYKP
jgi:cyclopropane-fatty-acyl-phospholipid synthase